MDSDSGETTGNDDLGWARWNVSEKEWVRWSWRKHLQGVDYRATLMHIDTNDLWLVMRIMYRWTGQARLTTYDERVMPEAECKVLTGGRTDHLSIYLLWPWTWPMTLTFELARGSVRMNHCTKYMGQKVIYLVQMLLFAHRETDIQIDSHTDTHIQKVVGNEHITIMIKSMIRLRVCYELCVREISSE